ncbi:hypothetical protein O6H91_16G074700 [Diphasiastrum complanatum]|uniref:Uncharacterized protein n=2 Tax=Diphasiastrum complanatum TaxID=34168 RepID=A0ACC2BDX6_DIPCM|nr:hypothetical protein O6H91_16G074700 [Diphasiastrum complanatum]KAJ7527873.1 hypothetical protein O6H91_16G074700 [Diphasiastrum complanatum]
MGGGGDDCKVKISVWWDIENCMVPSIVRPHDVARNISKALRQENYRGPISISAYGDTYRLSDEVQTAITSTGINLHHIPSGHKDASDKAIIVDMLLWALDNPPPGHILLISGERDFSNAVHRLHMKNYNILLAGYLEESFSASLLGAATSVWHWTKLARGENAEASHPQKSDGISPGIVQPCNINIPVVPSAVSCNNIDDKNSSAMKISDQSAASLPIHTSVKVKTTAADGLKPDLIDIRTSFPSGGLNFHTGTSTGNGPITTSDSNARPASSNEVTPASYLPARPICTTGSALSAHGLSQVYSVQGHLPSNMSLPMYLSCIGIILKVMETLKREMLLPTGANIEACIHWSEQSPITFAIRQVLDKAVELGDIVVLSKGIGHVQVFIPNNTELWPCVDLIGPNEYAFEIWNTLHAWLYSLEGCQILSQSQSLFHAAVLLRKCGLGFLSFLPLAKVANLLHLAAAVKGWLRPAGPCSWSPLVITVRDSFNRLSFPNGSFRPRQSGMECAQSVEIQSHEQKASKPHTVVDANSVMKKLRCWLISVLCTEKARKGYDIASLRKDFEVECKVKLNPSEVGFSTLVNLIKQLKGVARLEHARPNECLLFPANEEAVLILSKLRSWLRETLSTEKASNGYDISLVKKNFELDCNIKLDPHKLGFDKLQDLISLFTDDVHFEHPRKDTCLLFLKESSRVAKVATMHTEQVATLLVEKASANKSCG